MPPRSATTSRHSANRAWLGCDRRRPAGCRRLAPTSPALTRHQGQPGPGRARRHLRRLPDQQRPQRAGRVLRPRDRGGGRDHARCGLLAGDPLASPGRDPSDRDRAHPPPVAAVPALPGPGDRHCPPGPGADLRPGRAAAPDGWLNRQPRPPRLPDCNRGGQAAGRAARDRRRARGGRSADRRGWRDGAGLGPDRSPDRFDRSQPARPDRAGGRDRADLHRGDGAGGGGGRPRLQRCSNARPYHRHLAALQQRLPSNRRGRAGRPPSPLRPGRDQRRDDSARPGPGGPDGRAVALATARLVPGGGRRRRAPTPERGERVRGTPAQGRYAGGKPGGGRAAPGPDPARYTDRAGAATAAGADQESPPLSAPGMGSERHLRCDHDRVAGAGHLLGSL